MLALSSMYEGGSEFWQYWLVDKHLAALDKRRDGIRVRLGPPQCGSSSLFLSLKRITLRSYCLLLDCARTLLNWLVVLSDSIFTCGIMCLFWFGYTTHELISHRTSRPAGLSVDHDALGFGQIVPMFLLASTIFVVKQALDGMFYCFPDKADGS